MAKPLAYFHFHEIVLSLGDALPLSWCTWCTPGWSRGLHSQTRSSQRSLSGPWSTGHSLLGPFICRICNKVPRTVCLNVILYGWNRYQLALTCTRHRRGSVAAGRCTSWSRRGRRGWTSLWSRQLTNSQTQRTLMRRNSQSWSKTDIKHCQRHNRPEGWVLLTKVTYFSHITSSNKNIAKGTTDPGVDCFDQ